MKITKNMTIGEIIRKYPQVIDTLMSFGMGCMGCPSAQVETLEEATKVHGIDVGTLEKALNEAI
ncbi:MAG: DUF1858 domain-containing protein [Clostridiaceae bacterium]|nr:DUF1858 domain-containing protein [Clostridiaceae bacterium]